MFKELSHFTPLTQLITGINFAFILGNFIDKVIQVLQPERIIEDERETISKSEKRFSLFRIPIIANIIIDIESLKSLEPINDKSQTKVAELIERYEQLRTKRSTKRKELIDRIENNNERHKSSGSFKPLFLVCSLYSIINLLVSCLGGNEFPKFAETSNLDMTFLEISFIIFNILVLILCITLLFVSIFKREHNLPKRFINLIIAFTGFLILSFIIGWIVEHKYIEYYTTIYNNHTFWNLFFWISVFLPFFALLSCCIYIFYLRIEGKLELGWYNIRDRFQLQKLKKEKRKIDNAYQIFK